MVGTIGGATAVEASAAGCADAPIAAADAAGSLAATQAVTCLVNVERARRGLHAVAKSGVLSRAAIGQSADMVRLKFFADVSPLGMTLRKRIVHAGYRKGSCPPTLGEVLAFGDTLATAASLVSTLMADPAHKSVMLDRRYRDVGVGIAVGAPMDGMGDGVTLALSFGRR